MRVKIDVTARDIRRGRPWRADACPLFLACDRLLRDVETVYFCVAFQGSEDYVDLPPRAMDWVNDFDLGNPVKPFSFTLNVPAKLVRK